MKTVRVELWERGYDIRIGTGVDLATVCKGGEPVSGLLVTDTNVDSIHGDSVTGALAKSGVSVVRMVIPAGEASKSHDQLKAVYDAAFSAGLDRESVFIALGGGVVGDLVGFAAATFLRGVRLIQVPTSLLAMVDSAVGGKTAINVAQGKNLIGAFYQPVEVDVDLSTLKSLPDREYLSGMAEVVKYGVIWDADFFALLEGNIDSLKARDQGMLEQVIARSCEIKAKVVADDEREGGRRAILNFGHTLAHALEKAVGYGVLLHGEAVSIGMAYAMLLSEKQNELGSDAGQRLTSLLQGLDLPVSVKSIGGELQWAVVREAMSFDKKSRKGAPTFVLADSVGKVSCGCEVPYEVLEQCFYAIG